ncbi:MAG: alpha/beta fold hydrolase [Rhodovibrionaceae bacterium]
MPSLINRAYILDLRERQSFLRWLAGHGFRPLLLDWGAPGEAERGFTLTDYIAGRLSAALDVVLAETGARPALLGYCMGGTLALALAQLRQDSVRALALLAAPWDFHAGQEEIAKAGPMALLPYKPAMQLLGVLPTDALQALFAGLDPLLTARKFLKLAELDPASPQAEAFVALEDWLNDGIPLSAAVAEEALEGWYGRNDTAAGRWQVDGETVDPAAVTRPCLAILPSNDRIVPPASAAALAAALPDCRVLQPRAGHIGLMTAARAPQEVWQPLADWLKEEVL